MLILFNKNEYNYFISFPWLDQAVVRVVLFLKYSLGLKYLSLIYAIIFALKKSLLLYHPASLYALPLNFYYYCNYYEVIQQLNKP